MRDNYFALACLLTGFSHKKLIALHEKTNCFEKIWKASKDELILLGLTEAETQRFLSLKESLNKNSKLDSLWCRLKDMGINIVSLSDSFYPPLLREISFRPLLLFYKGKLPNATKPWVAIVGSRICSSRGRNLAKELAFELSSRGFTIVSGLARGIDTYAHIGALEGSGETVAVLGCGLDIDYPFENRFLKEKIVQKGALITEFLIGVEPMACNFPQRNRIIAGLSQAVIVVEARVKSGALITAHLAADYGREVMAFPGGPENPYTRGCNRLIKEGAYLVENLEDILEILGFSEKSVSSNEVSDLIYEGLSEQEKRVVDLLKTGVRQVDEIIRFCGREAISLLTILEVKGVVSRQPGQVFTLNHQLKGG